MQRSSFSKTLFYLLIFTFFSVAVQAQSKEENNPQKSKIEGLTFVSKKDKSEKQSLEAFANLNAEWVCLAPFAEGEMGTSNLIYYTNEPYSYANTKEGIIESIQEARNLGLKVMLKPHVTFEPGWGWAGEFTLDNPGEWMVFEENYASYILELAVLAQEQEVELFCIGTEFKLFAANRPDFWRRLISKVRCVYEGKLTYASNWDNYHNILFWEGLDYIGLDLYCPLAQELNPKVEKLVKAWQKPLEELELFHKSYEKPILLTEFGYMSIDRTAWRHWENEPRLPEIDSNYQAQADAFDAIFSAFWKEDWIAGGFIWRWYYNTSYTPHPEKDHTPQGKPAEKVIQKWYK